MKAEPYCCDFQLAATGAVVNVFLLPSWSKAVRGGNLGECVFSDFLRVSIGAFTSAGLPAIIKIRPLPPPAVSRLTEQLHDIVRDALQALDASIAGHVSSAPGEGGALSEFSDDRHHVKVKVFHDVASVLWVVGRIVAIVGALLAIPTGGIGLIVALIGVVVAIAGKVTFPDMAGELEAAQRKFRELTEGLSSVSWGELTKDAAWDW